MRKKIPLLLLAITLIFQFMFCSSLESSPSDRHSEDLLEGSVLDVIDGDTAKIRLKKGPLETVRYLLIDTPETHHPQRGREELGIEAFLANREMVENRQVFLELDLQERDKYGRLLAYLWLDKDRQFMVNEELVRRGFAMPLTIPPNVKYAERIHKALDFAREKDNGLWKRARKRHFSAAQAWAELPYLKGNFITLKIKVKKIIRSGNRNILLADSGHFSLVIYDSDIEKFAFLIPFSGKELKVVGKVMAGYHGGEIILKDPLQILDFGTDNSSTSP